MKDAEGYDQDYFLNLVLLHEQMHDEAITYTRQTVRYTSPVFRGAEKKDHRFDASNSYLTGDAKIPGGKFTLGSSPARGFVFDKATLGHEVEVAPFAISKTAVTNSEFKTFVEEGGYKRSELWTMKGWQWRTAAGADNPV